MANSKLLRPNVGIYVATATAFANWQAPTLAEITNPANVFNISPAITDDYTLNLTDSGSDTSLSMTDAATVNTPTFYNYTASLDGFRDANLTALSVYNKFRDLFIAPDVKYYLIKRVGKAHSAAFAVTDEISIYGVKTDYPVDILGDGQMVRMGARFLATGEVKVNVTLSAGTAGAGPELKSIVGTKMVANNKVKVAWVDVASVTNETTFLATPSAAILAAGVELTDAIAWDSYQLGAADSNKIEDRSLVDTATVQNRGFANFDASLKIFRGDGTAGSYTTAYTTFKAATTTRPEGYLVVRIGTASTTAFAAGQTVSVYRFIADSFADDTNGEDSVKWTINFMPQGKLGVNVTTAA